MIVKNEAHVIERCLRSVRPWIDTWAICDTGSTDGTQGLIQRFLKDVPGELAERPWVNFAHNRNEALLLAARHGDYALLIDADDELEVDSLDLTRLEADAYRVEFLNAGMSYFRELLVKLASGWRWQGVVHETLVGSPGLRTLKLTGARIRERREGARSKRPPEEKYGADAALLQADFERDPGNCRTAFYLAQSLRDAGRLSEAISAYEHRAAMGGWDEEVFYSKLQIAQLLQRQGVSDERVVGAHLAAFECRPTRAEPLCYIARFYREANRHALAHVFAEAASAIPRPTDILFVDASVYEWRAKDELAIASYWTGRREQSARLCRELLDDGLLPPDQIDRVASNLRFATG
jgi:hypothetical protein